MQLDQASRLAQALLDCHGLSEWQIIFMRYWTVTAGKCVRPLKWLLLSAPIVLVNNEAAVREVVLHEIAHMLTVGGHTREWRRKAIEIGATGEIRMMMVRRAERRLSDGEAQSFAG